MSSESSSSSSCSLESVVSKQGDTPSDNCLNQASKLVSQSQMPKTNETVFKESRRVLNNLSQIFSFGKNTPNTSSKADQIEIIGK